MRIDFENALIYVQYNIFMCIISERERGRERGEREREREDVKILR
jgi:hypothetical protein